MKRKLIFKKKSKALMKLTYIALTILTTSLVGCGVEDSSFNRATMLNKHGLTSEAKSELIDVTLKSNSNEEKAKAMYMLGSIAFEENRISVALDSWKELASKYPESKEAIKVKDKIEELSNIVNEYSKESIDNAVASSYLRTADFWSDDKDKIFRIDSSWIPNVETAIKWYDKVILEFPNSKASKVAYQDKLRTILGWKDIGQYGSSYGIKYSFVKYIPILLETFSAFEKEHPDAPTLQAFRYQIAQVYWNNRDWAKTREWLNIIIDEAGDSDSFYKDLAMRRLNKVEY